MAYRLELPIEAQIHPVVHVSQLKRRLGPEIDVYSKLPAVNTDGNLVLRPKRAVEYRQIKRGGRWRWEVMIEWETLPIEEATWEILDIMKERYPEFGLEDKAALEGDGNDTNEGRELKRAYNRVRRERRRAQAQLAEESAQASS